MARADINDYFDDFPMDQDKLNKALQMEWEIDFEGLEQFFDDLDIDNFNREYLAWMKKFESLAVPKAGFPKNLDVDYNIVDMMFEEGLTAPDAVLDYWNRKNKNE